MIVYNSNPGAVAPRREKVVRGLKRDDLFTVVLEHFQTDTADYADVLLPATTQLEHDDLHKAYGHLYLMYNRRAIEPLGEALPNSEIFRRLAAKMRLDDPELKESDEEMMIAALLPAGEGAGTADEGHPSPGPSLGSGPPSPGGRGLLNILQERGWVRIDVPKPHLPFKAGARLRTPSGKIEIESKGFAAAGADALPSYIPPYESEERNPELVQRYPLALISPPAHAFLNSTFVNVASLRRSAGKPALEIHADDATARDIATGDRVTIYNDRGRFIAVAVVTDRVRPGVVAAPSIWWPKLTADRANANHTTSEAITDVGGGATFYDNMVEVAPA
jgi:anaerobic selenocysteine-containing dehydrogenase